MSNYIPDYHFCFERGGKMTRKERVKNILLYGGVGPDNYEMVKPSMTKVNRTMIKTTSAVATVLIFIMFMSAVILEESGNIGRIVHTTAFIVSCVLCVLSNALIDRYSWLVKPMLYTAYSVFYIYGILVGIMVEPDEKTVLFMVMIAFLPIVFVDRPLHVAIVTGSYIVIFIGLCFYTKTGIRLIGDVRNALAFGFLGIAAGVIGDYFKINGYVLQYRLKDKNKRLRDDSRIDKLTKMQNRNAYESDFYKIAKRCEESIGCIYFDVNGLKNLNDNKGHEEGDKMLQYVASQIRRHFDEEICYRIGGDEFVAFIIDPEFYEIKNRTDDFLAEIVKRGYYASVGWKIHDIDVLNMKDLISAAESEMYRKKVDFYKQVGYDRRRN